MDAGKFSRPGADALDKCRAGEITLTPDQDWGPMVEAAEDFVLIFFQPGTYTGYCDLHVRALRLEGVMGKNRTFIDCRVDSLHEN